MRVASDRDHAWVDVADTGPGIPDHEANRIFDRLFRGQYAIDEEKQGAGLGLAIAHSIVEEFGGELRVVPQPVGACLRLTVPLATST
jgi:signal transduction histidine kinase